MSLVLHCKNDSFASLVDAWPQRVLSLQQAKGLKSKLKIGLVNLMPEKTATEKQWYKAMAAADDWIEPQLIRMASYSPIHEPEVAASCFYKDSICVDLHEMDAVIVTGAPVEHLDFEAVAYWQELSVFLEACLDNARPVLAVCWAAQALLYQRFSLKKVKLAHKCFGLYAHEVKAPELGLNLNQRLMLPHSRHTGWLREDLEQQPELKLILDSTEAGPFALSDERGNYYFAGHGEYEADTLVREYVRDLEKGKTISIPKGFSVDAQGTWSRDWVWEEDFYHLFNHWIKTIPRNHLLEQER